MTYFIKNSTQKKIELFEVFKFLKSIYVNENDSSLKNKKYQKLTVFKDNDNLTIDIHNRNSIKFIPIFVNQDIFLKPLSLEILEKKFLSDVKKINNHLPEFILSNLIIHAYEYNEIFLNLKITVSTLKLDDIYREYQKEYLKSNIDFF